MPTINDYKKKALNDAGYSGDISTAEWKWLKDICYPYVGAIPDMWRYALRQMGFSGSLIEAQSAMLKGLGYTDFSMNNKWYKYWRDTPLEGTTWWEFGSALDLDFANNRGFNSVDRDKTTPDSILTYTSPSPKMVYGDDGVLFSSSGTLPYDHDPVTLEPLGVLIEEQRTNLTIYSGDYSNAAWSGSATSKTSGQSDVLGGTGAGLVTADGSSALHTAFNGSFVSYTSGTTYAFSRFVKAGTQSLLQLIPPTTAFGATAYANFNLSGAGSVTQSAGLVASGIEALADGWYRVWVSVTATASVSASSGSLAFISTTTDARGSTNTLTTNFYDFGGQVEAGAFPTSYIPTVASQVTRAADQVSISGSEFAVSATAGTILLECNYLGGASINPGARAPVYLGDGTNTHRVLVLNGSGGLVRGFIGASGTQFDQSIGSDKGSAFFKAAIAFEANNANIASGGVTGAVDTAVTVPSNLNSLRVGYSAIGIGQISGHVKRLTYYNTRKIDAEIAALTA